MHYRKQCAEHLFVKMCEDCSIDYRENEVKHTLQQEKPGRMKVQRQVIDATFTSKEFAPAIEDLQLKK